MLAKRIIPCLDIKDGKVVKGVKFINLRYACEPHEAALRYEKEGADEIVFLDITASYQRRKILLEVVEKTQECLFIPFTVGGGIRTIEDIKDILRAGADKVSINTAAVEKPNFIKEAAANFGSQCIVVAIDAKKEGDIYRVYTHGGRKRTDKEVISWAKQVEELGAGEILITSMDRDGTRLGYDIELLKKISQAVNLPVIASGGAGNLEHLFSALTEGGADAVLCASIFHYQDYTIWQVKKYLKKRGILVRI